MGTQDPDLKMLMAFPNDDVRLRFRFDDRELHLALGPAKAMDWMSDEALEIDQRHPSGCLMAYYQVMDVREVLGFKESLPSYSKAIKPFLLCLPQKALRPE